jgi:metallo-beta-lactamase class B
MERKMFISLLVMLLCLSWGFLMKAMAQCPQDPAPVQNPAKMWTRSSSALQLKDTPAIQAEMAKARQLAGNDWYFLQLQRLQCNDVDESNTVVQTPGVNMGGTGWHEVSAVPTKVFDNVYYVGGMEVGGWVIDTGAGYIMLDAGYNYSYEEFLIPNMKKLGLDPAKVKYILLTHTGPDHIGAAKYFQDNYGTKIVFNNTIVNNPFAPGVVATVMPDGGTLTLGDTTVTMVHTPRSKNPDGSLGDGFSYFIPVKIQGRHHTWATYGNTGINGPIANIQVYLDSMANWLTYVHNLRPDIAMSSHPFVDGSIRRMELIRECDDRHSRHDHSRNDLCGPHNPFLIGERAARRYFEIMNQCAVVRYERAAAGLADNGLGPYSPPAP